MASYKKRSSTWTCYYYTDVVTTDPATGALVKQRRQRSESGFATKRDAMAWNAERELRERRGFSSEPGTLTLRSYAEAWWESLRPGDYSPSTLRGYRDHLDFYILPILGDVRLSRLDDRTIQAWHATLLKTPYRGRRAKEGMTLSVSTVAGAHRVLSIICNDAVKRKKLAENPARLAGGPRLPRRPSHNVWDSDQIKTFLEFADSVDAGEALLYRFMLMTAARPGEALALRWDAIDWRRQTVTIMSTRTRDIDRQMVIGSRSKTRNSDRTLNLQTGLVERLRQHRIRQNETRLKLGSRWHDLGLVFPRPNGMMQNDATFNQRLARWSVRAGVPRLTPHELRHTSATLMILNGVPLEVVSEQLGHASITTTANLYGHLTPGMIKRYTDEVERWIEESSGDEYKVMTIHS